MTPSARWRMAVALTAVVLVAYAPALRGEFIWDDYVLISTNPLVLAADGLWRIWFTTQAVDYWPVTNTSFWLEWRLWGENPLGYHVTNVVLHAVNAWLLWRLLVLLRVPGAMLAAALFALHPLNVESVAWITQRKNTLSLFFGLIAAWAYLRRDEAPALRVDRRSTRRDRPEPSAVGWRAQDSVSLAAFTLGMLSKGSVATLPAMLLVLTWWREGRLTRRDLVRVLPFVAVAGALTIVNVYFQARGGGGVIRDVTVLQRILGAVGTVWFYAGASLFPFNRMFVHPQWRIDPADWFWWAAVAGLIAVIGLLWRSRGRSWARSAAAVGALVVLAIGPVMGLTDVFYMKFALVSDHYAYPATAIVCAAAAALLSRWRTRLSLAPAGSWTLAVAVLLTFGLSTWFDSGGYVSARELYARGLAANPGAWILHNNLATLYMKGTADERRQALDHLREATVLNPTDATVRNNLGAALLAAGDLQGALREHTAALQLDPTRLDARANRAADLIALGRLDEGIAALTEVLGQDPTRAEARGDLARALDAAGRPEEAAAQWASLARPAEARMTNPAVTAEALTRTGRISEALAYYEAASRLQPDSVVILNNWSHALITLGRMTEAETKLRAVLSVAPRNAAALANLGNVLQRTNRLQDALAAFSQALEYGRGPALADIHNDAGIVYARLGQRDDAMAHFREALRIRPGFVAARNNLTRAESER